MLSFNEIAAPNPNQRPRLGQRTRSQRTLMGGVGGLGGVFPAMQSPAAGCDPATVASGSLWPYWMSLMCGTYPTYRMMRGHPTIALALSIILSPIIASAWEVDADEDADQRAIDWVYDNIIVHRQCIVRHGARAVWLSNQPFEIVWGMDGGVYTIEKFKPLLNDITQILEDKKGNFGGLRNNGEELHPNNAMLIVHDDAPGEPYGRSRLENCRDSAWLPWLNTARRSDILDQRVSDILPYAVVPPGSFEDEVTGDVVNYAEEALKALSALRDGDYAVLQSLGFSADDINQRPELAKISQVTLDTIDFGNRGASQASILDKLAYYDKLCFRGLLRSERTGMEADTAGSRADSEQHTATGVNDSELIDDDIAAAVNLGPINTGLRLNFPGQAGAPGKPGKVRIKPAPLVDTKRKVYADLMKQMMGDSTVARAVADTLDVDRMLAEMDLPTLALFVDKIADARAEQQQQKQAELDAKAKQPAPVVKANA